MAHIKSYMYISVIAECVFRAQRLAHIDKSFSVYLTQPGAYRRMGATLVSVTTVGDVDWDIFDQISQSSFAILPILGKSSYCAIYFWSRQSKAKNRPIKNRFEQSSKVLDWDIECDHATAAGHKQKVLYVQRTLWCVCSYP